MLFSFKEATLMRLTVIPGTYSTFVSVMGGFQVIGWGYLQNGLFQYCAICSLNSWTAGLLKVLKEPSITRNVYGSTRIKYPDGAMDGGKQLANGGAVLCGLSGFKHSDERAARLL